MLQLITALRFAGLDFVWMCVMSGWVGGNTERCAGWKVGKFPAGNIHTMCEAVIQLCVSGVESQKVVSRRHTYVCKLKPFSTIIHTRLRVSALWHRVK